MSVVRNLNYGLIAAGVKCHFTAVIVASLLHGWRADCERLIVRVVVSVPPTVLLFLNRFILGLAL